MCKMSIEIPKNCLKFINHGKIVEHDIDRFRPSDQTNITTERVVSHGFRIKEIRKIQNSLFLKPKYIVFSITVYEMAGDYISHYMGGRCWAETDNTGLEWTFATRKEAEDWMSHLYHKEGDIMKEVLEVRFDIEKLLDHELDGQSLREYLVDSAEDEVELSRTGFKSEEVETTNVSIVDGSEFVVQFVVVTSDLKQADGNGISRKGMVQDDDGVWMTAQEYHELYA